MMKYLEKLDNYRSLTARVDEFCQRISAEYAEFIACREGCGDCCRHFTLFPVEAVALAAAISGLPAEESAYIRSRALMSSNGAACPLLEDGRCLIYAARPIICRTHGFPLLAGRDEQKVIDFCPKNFNGITSFTAAFVLDLEHLNATLAAVNSVFIAACRDYSWSDNNRFTMAEALMLMV